MASSVSPNSGTPSMKPIEALNRLWEITLSYCVSQVFWAGCALGVFEELGRAPATAAELSKRIKIHPDGCRRLLAALEQLRLVEREAERFRNTGLGAYCTSKSAVNLSPLAGGPIPSIACGSICPMRCGSTARAGSKLWEPPRRMSSAAFTLIPRASGSSPCS